MPPPDKKNTNESVKLLNIGHVMNGDATQVEQHLEAGADVNAILVPTLGFSALYIAASKGHKNVAQLLLNRGAEVDGVDDHSIPLHRAAFEGHADVVQLLVDHGADVHARDDEGRTPLLSAASSNLKIAGSDPLLFRRYRNVIEIVCSFGIDVDARTNAGFTALDFAVNKECATFAKIFIMHGAAVNSRIQQPSLLFNAVKRRNSNQYQLTGLLLEHGAEVNTAIQVASALDVAYCTTPLDWTSKDNNEPLAQLLMEWAGGFVL